MHRFSPLQYFLHRLLNHSSLLQLYQQHLIEIFGLYCCWIAVAICTVSCSVLIINSVGYVHPCLIDIMTCIILIHCWVVIIYTLIPGMCVLRYHSQCYSMYVVTIIISTCFMLLDTCMNIICAYWQWYINLMVLSVYTNCERIFISIAYHKLDLRHLVLNY